MPAWIHSRAEHLLARNPSMAKSQAFALATQQAHKLGKTPKGYGTAEGRAEAKAKYDKPKKEYVKTPNPEGLDSPKLEGKPKEAALAPAQMAQLAGLGLGAGLGAAGGAAAAGKGHRLRGALLGGAAGGALGGAAGYAAPRLQAGLKGGLSLGESTKALGEDVRARASRYLKRGGEALSPAKPKPTVPTYEQAVSQVVSKNQGRAPVSTGQMRDAWLQKADQERMLAQIRGDAAKMSGPSVTGARPAAASMSTSAVGPQPARLTQATGAASPMAKAAAVNDLGGLGALVASCLKELYKKADLLPGGVGDDRPDSAFDSKQLAVGMKTESEHTKNKKLQKEISKDHLTESGSYYQDLKKMEGAEKKASATGGEYSLLDQVGRPKTKQLSAEAPNPTYRVKQAFSVSQYSGDLGPGAHKNYAGYLPPFRVPQLRQAGASNEELAMAQKEMNKKDKAWMPMSKLGAMCDELAKLNSVQSPEAQITKSQKVGAPRASAPPGPSIHQIAKPIGYGRPLPGATKTAEAEKLALFERLVRLGATPIKGTPKLLMKLRTPAELVALQKSVEQGYAKRVTDPLMRVAQKGLSKLPEGRLRNVATKGAELFAEDPAGMVLSNLVPVPGANPAYVALKKGGEKLIDRFAPAVA